MYNAILESVHQNFFIVCGDLVDAMPNLWPDIRREQEKDFLEIYSELDPEIPLGRLQKIKLVPHKSFYMNT